jgi:AcrR family transcriptional regulator
VRADSARNRARVLAAAEAAFTADGLAVPLDGIAKRAGVGVGTVYRHFPTKEALFEAVVVNRLRDLVDTTPDAGEPGETFTRFLIGMVEQAVGNKALFDAFDQGGSARTAAVNEAKAELMRHFGTLLASAQRAGAIRPDLTVADLGALVVGCLAMHRQSPDSLPRLLDVALAGLRPPR